MGVKQGLLLLGWVIFLALAETWAGPKGTQGASDRRLVTNFSFAVMTFTVGAIFPLVRLTASSTAQALDVGLLRPAHFPWLVVFTVALLAETFANYWIHRMWHGTPLLWRIHRVHHADNAVDLSTSLRNHPLEFAITLPVSAALVLILGTPTSVVVATQTLLLAATLLEHTDIRLPARLDRGLALVIVTPRVHRLHHNPERATHDSNYGELFTLWDRLFGTFNGTERRERVGLDDQVARPDRLLQQIWSPVHAV